MHTDCSYFLVYEQSIEAAADESVSEFDSDEDLEEYDGADAADAKEYLDSRRRMSTGSNDSYPNTAERRGSSSRSDFYQDASASIYDSLVKNDDPANVQLELTALRMSANASEHAVRRAVASAFVRRIVQLLKGDGTAGGAPAATSAKQAVTRTFSRHGSHLIGRVVFDKATAAKPDQVDFLLLVQTALAAQLPREDDSNSTGKPSATASTAATGADAAMLFVANHLYTQDILDTGAFEQWWQDPRSTSTEQLRWARGKMGQFMDVLLADSESEDDEDDDDEEDDEDG